ncbi:MAG: cytochrome P450, partial [Candidatus Xenobia bacterium]
AEMESINRFFYNWILFIDPPQHTRLRSLVMKAFTPRRVEAMRPAIEEQVDSLLDALQGRESADIYREVAYPLPSMVIARILGIDARDWEKLKRWSTSIANYIAQPAQVTLTPCLADLQEMTEYFRRVAPGARGGDHVLGSLLEAHEEADRLSEDEVLATCMQILVAGHETTTNMICNATVALLQNPAQAEIFRTRPDLTENAIEELLRWDTSVQSTVRRTVEPTAFGEFKVQKDRLVSICIGAANHDPRVMEKADQLDITRPAPTHIAFGAGIHFCLGAALARLELQIVLRRMFDRFPQMQLATDTVTYREFLAFRGPVEVPVRLSLPVRESTSRRCPKGIADV